MKNLFKYLFIITAVIGISLFLPSEKLSAEEARSQKKIDKIKQMLTDSNRCKSGKYYYYLEAASTEGTVLIRENSKGKTKQIGKNITQFAVEGGQIFYKTDRSPSLFVMNTDGSEHKRFDTYVGTLYMVRDGYVYYSRFGNLFRCAAGGGTRQRLVRSNYGQEFVITKDRIYYVVQKLKNDMTGTEYSYVRSCRHDGTDIRTEIGKRSGWGHIMSQNDSVIVEYPPQKNEKNNIWYVLSSDGSQKKIYVSDITRTCSDCCASPDEDAFYFLTSAVTDGDGNDIYSPSDEVPGDDGNASTGYVSERENAIYKMDMDGNLEKIINLDDSGVKLTYEYNILEKSGRYFIITTGYDQSMSCLYVMNTSGRKLLTIDLTPLGEEGTFDYKIVKKVLYLRFRYDGITKYYSYRLSA